ncbi:HAD family hydrolase [Streptomyces sp. NPDC091292]|uniref:HAD family hydrolase n=1 Tax=Streptomyces sp. NPDC091292 TaxID=3365991 RepID=UPI003810B8F9
MTIKGVLFDFSGTLFRAESTDSWLRAALGASGTAVGEAEFTRLSAELEAVGALPGGATPARVPEELTQVWDDRDIGSEQHRAAYTGIARQVRLPGAGLHDALYERHMAPAAWHPYPDAAEVLKGLHARGVAVAVVSNIGWDLRPVFLEHGVDAYVGAYALSFEHGIQKPDPRLFGAACDALDVDARNVLMVGDNRHADGGATALGCAVHFVDHLPARDRPDGLRPVLDLVDRAS